VKNIVMDGHEANDIRQQVEKILRGLGNPPSPLNLDDVRELLKLDRRYFSGDDQSAVREVVSRLMVAGKQLLRLSLGALKPATRGRVQNQQVNGRSVNVYSSGRYA
jgi:hypothetical protein